MDPLSSPFVLSSTWSRAMVVESSRRRIAGGVNLAVDMQAHYAPTLLRNELTPGQLLHGLGQREAAAEHCIPTSAAQRSVEGGWSGPAKLDGE